MKAKEVPLVLNKEDILGGTESGCRFGAEQEIVRINEIRRHKDEITRGH